MEMIKEFILSDAGSMLCLILILLILVYLIGITVVRIIFNTLKYNDIVRHIQSNKEFDSLYWDYLNLIKRMRTLVNDTGYKKYTKEFFDGTIIKVFKDANKLKRKESKK